MTLLFVPLAAAVALVLVIAALFQLGYCLITRQLPESFVRRFAERLIEYGRDIARYLTFNREKPPFPFADFSER